MAKGTDSKNNKGKSSTKNRKAKPLGKPTTRLARTPVLSTEGVKTEGLSRKEGIEVKKVNNYQVNQKQDVKPALAQEKARAKAIKALLDSLHPGYNVPEETRFKGLVLSNRDLTRVRFTDNSLKNTKLRDCQLRGAVFKNCDLSGADFRRSELTDVIFDHCNLTGADLRNCNLANARIVDSNLFAANLDNSILDHAIIDHCAMGAQSFYNSSCKGIKLFNSQILHGFFDSTDLADAEIRNMMFRDCTLTNTHFERAVLDECYFRSCDSAQQGPIFSDCTMSNISMMGCELEEIQMISTQVSQSRFERVNMSAALLEGTQFNDVVFHSGTMKDCYSLEQAPTFSECTLEHLLIDHSELCNAHFNNSLFLGAMIIASDFEDWELNHTRMDDSTMVESGLGH